MVDLDELSGWRERLAKATGGVPADEPGLGEDLKRTLAHVEVAGDPTQDILAAIDLCEACGLQWTQVATADDVQHVKHPTALESSGFHIHNDNVALAMCRGIVSELWLAHPDRA